MWSLFEKPIVHSLVKHFRCLTEPHAFYLHDIGPVTNYPKWERFSCTLFLYDRVWLATFQTPVCRITPCHLSFSDLSVSSKLREVPGAIWYALSVSKYQVLQQEIQRAWRHFTLQFCHGCHVSRFLDDVFFSTTIQIHIVMGIIVVPNILIC